MRSARGLRTAALVAGGVLAAAAAGSYIWTNAASNPIEGIPIAKVAKGPLRISVLERGNLKAKKTTTIRSELEGESKILYLIPEGKSVTAGELLIELDVSQQKERRVSQKISYDQAEASYIDAKEKLAIQQNQNLSNIKKAELALDVAGTTVKKYLEGDFPQKKQTQESRIKIAEQELSQAKERFEWSKKLYEKGFLTKTEFEQDELNVNKSMIDVDLAKRDLSLLVEYEYPMEEKILTADVGEAERELERVRRQAAAEQAQAEANLKARTSTLDLEREKLRKLDQQIERSRILAPTDGVVVYAGSGGGGRRNEEMITIGARVSEREELLELPDPSRMIAEAKFHESIVDQIAVGYSAVVTIDARSDSPLAAKVTYLSVVPDSQSRWMNPDLRVYRAEVEIDGTLADLKPQMSCSIEIVTQDLADAVYVPVQAVFRKNGKPICYVVRGTEVHAAEVQVGLSNERNVEIKKGLAVGDSILLALPPGVGSDLPVDSIKTQVGEVVSPAPANVNNNGDGADRSDKNGDMNQKRPPADRMRDWPRGRGEGAPGDGGGRQRKKPQGPPAGGDPPKDAERSDAGAPGDK